MTRYRLTVNGTEQQVDAWDGDMPLLYALRNSLGLHAVKFGCGLGQCGACTVLVDGQPQRSCLLRLADAVDRQIVTAEGLGTPEKPHPVQAAFIAEQAAQCGYCTAGLVVAARALLTNTPRPSEEQVREALAGNLCRCGSHARVIRAVLRVAGTGGAR